jgi:hypothetical protein
MSFRIEQAYFDSIVYLYPDIASAKSGERIGGSGVLIGIPARDGMFSVWVATNRHVIEQGNWTIRVNTLAGGLDFIETDDRQWIHSSTGDDLSVRLLGLNPNIHDVKVVPISQFLTEDTRYLFEIGPGDPCFMVGRFVNHEGKEKNIPSARFGQIAQNPGDKVVVGDVEQESFLVEVRSIGGFSGSPVYVYLDQWYGRPMAVGRVLPDGTSYNPNFPKTVWLLGINWAMVPAWDPVCDSNGTPVSNNWIVPSNTGMAAVVPAWKLYALLMSHPTVLALRAEQEAFNANSAPTVIQT